MRRLLVALALLATVSVSAQTPPTYPAGQPFVINIGLPLGDPAPVSVEVDGFAINILLRGPASILLVGVNVPVNIPALPAGTYTVNVTVQYTDWDDMVINTVPHPPFTIVAAAVDPEHIPVLDPRSLGILAIALAFAAVFVMSRL